MRRNFVAIAVALVSLLAACEDEPDPATRPASTPPPVESSAPGPTTDEPIIDPMTAVETVRAWVAARGSDPNPRIGLGNCVVESLKLGLDPAEACDGKEPA